MLRKYAIASALMCVVMFTAYASEKKLTPAIDAMVPNAQIVGQSRLTVLFWKIYDATLFASAGDWQADQPFALSLTYLRDFAGEDIASRSIDEMRKQGVDDEFTLALWFEEMRQLFPDVIEGQTITGVVDAQGNSHFYLDQTLLGTIDDSEFSRRFFDIWLAANTSEPKMRDKLLGFKQ